MNLVRVANHLGFPRTEGVPEMWDFSATTRKVSGKLGGVSHLKFNAKIQRTDVTLCSFKIFLSLGRSFMESHRGGRIVDELIRNTLI